MSSREIKILQMIAPTVPVNARFKPYKNEKGEKHNSDDYGFLSPVHLWLLVEEEDGYRYITGWEPDAYGDGIMQNCKQFDEYICETVEI